MVEGGQSCPICASPVRENARYPRHLCGDCSARAASQDGRALLFTNAGMSGGYAARYADSGDIYPSHDCFVDGIACRADEARFGGIVIEAMA